MDPHWKPLKLGSSFLERHKFPFRHNIPYELGIAKTHVFERVVISHSLWKDNHVENHHVHSHFAEEFIILKSGKKEFSWLMDPVDPSSVHSVILSAPTMIYFPAGSFHTSKSHDLSSVITLKGITKANLISWPPINQPFGTSYKSVDKEVGESMIRASLGGVQKISDWWENSEAGDECTTGSGKSLEVFRIGGVGLKEIIGKVSERKEGGERGIL